jgi:hypothetical protein
MSEAINWGEMSDKEKVGLIIRHVMGYFLLPDSVYVDGRLKMPRGKQAPVGFHWPIAFWNSDIELWETKDIADNLGSIFFDPLHNLNDAWQIVEKLYDHYEIRLFMEKDNVQRYCVEVWYRDRDKLAGFGFVDSSMAEAVCIAALRAIGCEVIV